jgi:hypothetical protein
VEIFGIFVKSPHEPKKKKKTFNLFQQKKNIYFITHMNPIPFSPL